VLIALLYRSAIKISLHLSKIFIAVAIVLMIFLVFKGNGSFSEMADTVDGSSSMIRIALWGIPSAFLVFGFVFFEKGSAAPVFPNKWMLLLGDASYSIYLIHIIVYRSIYFVLKKILGTVSVVPGDIQIPIYMLIAIIASVAFYVLIEKKILRLLQRKFL
jgi:peptidoglycan/LPS O-acetylase OafA/YrhL